LRDEGIFTTPILKLKESNLGDNCP